MRIVFFVILAGFGLVTSPAFGTPFVSAEVNQSLPLTHLA